MNKKMKRIVLLVLSILWLLSIWYFKTYTPIAEYQQIKVTVKQGDTLWDYANAYCPSNTDIREWIDEVRRLNNLYGICYLKIGQEIIILKPT